MRYVWIHWVDGSLVLFSSRRKAHAYVEALRPGGVWEHDDTDSAVYVSGDIEYHVFRQEVR